MEIEVDFGSRGAVYGEFWGLGDCGGKNSIEAFSELFDEVYSESKDIKGYLNRVLK